MRFLKFENEREGEIFKNCYTPEFQSIFALSIFQKVEKKSLFNCNFRSTTLRYLT